MIRLLVAIACLLISISSYASESLRVVKPGEAVQLAPDEGLLLLCFDTNRKVLDISVHPKGQARDVFKINAPLEGKNVLLLVAKAGKYKWDEIHLQYSSMVFREIEKFEFEVKPGVFNYPGDLIYRILSYDASYHRANRGLEHIKWYKKTHPLLYERFPFEYSGTFPDPFPAFIAKENTGGIVEGKTKPVPATPTLNISVETLWKRTQILDAWISPDGNYIIEERRTAKGNVLEIIHRESGQVSKLDAYGYIHNLQWLNEKAFVITYGSSEYRSGSDYVSVSAKSDGKVEYVTTKILRNGFVIDPLRKNPDYFLYAGDSINTSGRMLVYMLSKRRPESLNNRENFRAQNAGNMKLDNLIHWITNRDGQIIAAVKKTSDGKMVFQKLQAKTFVDVKSLDENGIWPVAISPDGTRVFAISGENSDQKELVSVNSDTLEDMKPVFRMPGKDIVSIIFDENRQPIGARYYQEGMLVNHYFDSASAVIQKRLSKTFPDSNSVVIHKTDANDKSLVYVDSPSSPGSLYYFDQVANEISKIDDQAPWLEGTAFSKSKAIIARSTDGLDLEAYLTMPSKSTAARVPLVVVPHGGPIGVRDDRHFDRETQFLASLGYAVLKVNYRGSDGFGKAFRDAGKQSLGTKIEEDIEAVLAKALSTESIDSGRMCIVGSSYGGYSALVSVARWPDRYRCAVSVSGVSDRLLQFTASDSVLIPEVKKVMPEYFGDPMTQKDKMISEQPVYMYKRIKAPVMLVHGTDDKRVDYENALRMQYMLTMSGNIPVMLTIKNEGHGFQSIATKKLAWEAIAGFLAEHLGTAKVPAPVNAATP